MAEQDVVEVMARAINQTDLFAERTDAAKNALTALEQAGYAVVPREPTEAMLGDGMTYFDLHRRDDTIGIWRAMLAATSSPISTTQPPRSKQRIAGHGQ